jgi:hypothetical protein
MNHYTNSEYNFDLEFPMHDILYIKKEDLND